MSKLRTFIVEDNPVILNNLIATLEELSDVQVVGSVGSEYEAVIELQERADLAARRVVLSNYATTDMRRRCLELGADRVFDKSSELEELIAYCDSAAHS